MCGSRSARPRPRGSEVAKSRLRVLRSHLQSQPRFLKTYSPVNAQQVFKRARCIAVLGCVPVFMDSLHTTASRRASPRHICCLTCFFTISGVFEHSSNIWMVYSVSESLEGTVYPPHPAEVLQWRFRFHVCLSNFCFREYKSFRTERNTHTRARARGILTCAY